MVLFLLFLETPIPLIAGALLEPSFESSEFSSFPLSSDLSESPSRSSSSFLKFSASTFYADPWIKLPWASRFPKLDAFDLSGELLDIFESSWEACYPSLIEPSPYDFYAPELFAYLSSFTLSTYPSSLFPCIQFVWL